MADKNADSLNTLFDEKSMFVHMGGTWGKTQELSVIKSGEIWYKKAAVYAVTVFQRTKLIANNGPLNTVTKTPSAKY